GDAFSAQTDLNTFAFENCFDVFGNVFVFTVNQPRPPLHNSHLTPEAAIHLSKLQSHITAADDDQVLGWKVHVHHRRIVQIAHLIDARERRSKCTSANIDKNLV